MESADIAWANTRVGAAKANGKYDSVLEWNATNETSYEIEWKQIKLAETQIPY